MLCKDSTCLRITLIIGRKVTQQRPNVLLPVPCGGTWLQLIGFLKANNEPMKELVREMARSGKEDLFERWLHHYVVLSGSE